MQSSDLCSRRGDAHLWVIAFGSSVLINAALLATLGFITLEAARLRRRSEAPPAPPASSVVMIFPESMDTLPLQASVPPSAPRLARTSPDQAASRPDRSAFIGERNTRATSDRPADAAAAPLPSQAGIRPKDAMDIETTQSDYQDGELSTNAGSRPASITPHTPPATLPSSPANDTVKKSAAAAAEDSLPVASSPRESLIDGPNPVDVPVPEKMPGQQVEQTPRDPAKTAGITPHNAQAPATPTFKGFQRKTAVTGSISRTGRSALDVVDSPLGRYQAALSRAVEQEWQRNCVRHRDYITPGFLTVRFFVEPGGKVRSVQFVGDMETGEIQKGFTLNSIRDADIPSMPPALRKQYDQEPLELVFRFYF